MKTEKFIEKAVRENPEVAVVLEISARARNFGEREPALDSASTVGVAATPTAAQGSIHCYDSRHVLCDQRQVITGLK